MQSNTDSLNEFFIRTIEGLKQDAASKSQKIPVSSFRYDSDAITGQLFSADYFKYLIYGRGAGKGPPPENILIWVQNNPDTLARAKQVYKYITEKGLAYLIGRKIAKQGTDIHLGKKPGIDLLGVMEKNMPELLKDLAKNEATKIATELRTKV
jgi:hypothetical protein